METKEEVRREVYQRRLSAQPEEITTKSRLITDSLISLPEYKNAARLFLYVDCKNEVVTRDLIRRALSEGKQTAVPKCRDRRMDFFEIRDLSELSPGSFGILEPVTERRADWEDALMIMPGVAFDRNLHRIGYGGGYYDRYLASHPGLFCIALAFSFQVYAHIPFEECDIMPHILITEKEIIECKKLCKLD